MEIWFWWWKDVHVVSKCSILLGISKSLQLWSPSKLENIPGTNTWKVSINSLTPGRDGNNFEIIIFELIYQIDIEIILWRMPKHQIHDKSTWFRWWLGAVRQQAITWANGDPDLFRHMVSLGPKEFIAIVVGINHNTLSIGVVGIATHHSIS